MSEFHVEPLNGGLVTSRPASLLKDGELVQADGIYRPYSDSLWSAPANATFISSGSPAWTGVRYCGFDYIKIPVFVTNGSVVIVPAANQNFITISPGATVRDDNGFIPPGTTVSVVTSAISINLSAACTGGGYTNATFDADHMIVLQDTTVPSYQLAKATTTTSTASSIETITGVGQTFDSVAYNNQHVLLNGAHPNRVLMVNQTTREHGLKPVLASPTITLGTGTWAVSNGTGFYSYWTTEYDKPNNVESDFQGKPVVANVSTLTTKVTIQRPPRVNKEATHWRAYRSTKMTSTDQASANNENIFPSGTLCGEVALVDDGTGLTIVDGGASSSTSAQAAGSVGTVGSEKYTGVTWASTANATGASNSTYATLTYNNPGAVPFTGTPVLLELGTFGLTPSSIAAPVLGIQVAVTGKKTNNAELFVGLYSTNSPGAGDYFAGLTRQSSDQKAVPLTTSNATYTLGSASDDWGISYDPSHTGNYSNFQWVPNDFADGKFVVRLYGIVHGTGDVVSVDSVTVSVTYGAVQQTGNSTPFPMLELKPFGIVTNTTMNGVPPKATTGDIFQDSLVLNDVTAGNFIWYSMPGNIDQFPPLYYINFNTQEQDIVTCIKAVSTAMIVGMNGRLWRVTYLPRDTDAEFDRGRAVELLDSERGIVGPLAACRFTHPYNQQMLAFFSGLSLNMTDGYQVLPMTTDIDFRNLINQTYLKQTIVINNPETYEILLIYVPAGTSVQNGIMRFSYHTTHLKPSPIFMRHSFKCTTGSMGTVRSATTGILRNGTRVMYVTDGATVYRANQPPSSTATINYKTRNLYLSNIGRGTKVIQLWTYYTQYGYANSSPGTITNTLQGLRGNAGAPVPDADYSRIDTNNVSANILAYPTGTASIPKDQRLIKTAHNFGDSGVANHGSLSASGVTFDYSLDFVIFEHEPMADDFTIYG